MDLSLTLMEVEQHGKKMKDFIKNIITTINVFSFNSFFARKFLDFLVNTNEKTFFSVTHKNINMKFHTPNYGCYQRAKTFSTKEPETLEWINSFSNEKVFWDIGANIGLYSIYASMRGIKSFSFEPMSDNFNQLKKNMVLNKIDNNTIIPIPLSSNSEISKMNFKDIHVAGSSHSSFKSIYDQHNEKTFDKYYNTIGITGDDLLKTYKLEQPDYIKIDVDGNELECLRGLSKILINVKELLVEVNKDENKKTVIEFLKENNFLIKKTCVKGFDHNSPMENLIFKK